MKKNKLGLFIALAFLTAIPNSYSFTPTKLDDLDFGTFIRVKKLSGTSRISMDYNGNITCSDDLRPVQGNVGKPARVRYSGLSSLLSTVRFKADTGTSKDPQVSISNITTNPASVWSVLWDKDTVDVKHGADITFNAEDNINTVSGSFISYGENYKTTIDTNIPFHLTINEPDINISEVNPLNFGTLIASNTAKSITIDGSGNTSGDTEIIVKNSNIKPTAGVYKITSKENLAVTVTVPKTLVLKDGGNSMQVTGLNAYIGNSNAGTLNNGTATMTVGGTLTVGANQAPGSYTGSYSIIIDY